MKHVFTVLMFRWNCEKEKILPQGKRLAEQLFTVSKDDPTDYLLITKGKTPALQWSNLVESTWTITHNGTNWLQQTLDVISWDCPASPGYYSDQKCSTWIQLWKKNEIKSNHESLNASKVMLWKQIKQSYSSRLNDTFTTPKLNGIYKLWKDLRLREKKMKNITEITGNSEYWLYIGLHYFRNINFLEHDNGILS